MVYALGPVSFSLTKHSKADTDITESFRFNLGTTFCENFK